MARYFLRFRHSDTGLTPSFTFFKKASDTTNVVPQPGITELPPGYGTYYFDYSPTFDIVFEVDGGASIPTEEVRYISDTISPKDIFIDEPTSQVKDDVWNDAVNRSVGTKGDFVEQIGVPTDNSAQATLFGKTLLYKESIRGDTAGTSDGNDVEEVYDAVAAANTAIGTPADTSAASTLFGKTLLYKESVRGDTAGTSDGNDVEQVYDQVADIQGVGFATGTDSLKIISDNVDAINIETNAADIANAVWDDVTNRAPGTKGDYLENIGSPPSAAIVASAVWDKALSSHVLPGSFGQTLQLLNNDTAAAGSPTTITLGASAVGTLDFYKNALLVITGGAGAGQARAITAYTALKVATVDRTWGVNPDNTSQYIVIPAANTPVDSAAIADAVWDEALSGHVTDGSFGQTLQMSDTGTLQAGAASTATLKLAASAITDFYKNGLLVVTAGTGVGQSRSITAYDGATKIATVDRAWGTVPTGGSGYMVVPAAPSSSLTVGGIADAVWDESMAAHLLVGSTGEKLNTGGAAGVQFFANGDTVNPVVLQVSSPKHTQVKITFSEPVVMTTGSNGALNLGNYTIPGLTLIAVSSLTAQQVLLTTSAQTPDFLYSLSIINVEDLSGNPIL